MSLFNVGTLRLKMGSAVLGVAAVVAMAIVGVAAGGAPDARAFVEPGPSPMTEGQTATATSLDVSVVPKASPVVKAPRYGKGS